MGWSSEGHEEHEVQRRKLLALADAWTIPRFPLDGGDVKALGIEEGPKVGALLRDIEQCWIDSDFAPDRDTLLVRLKDAARKHKG
jgi:poly(A) polymerase